MPQDRVQNSFGGGVLSPAAFARFDLQKFGTAVKTADNFFVHAEGGISNRAGLQFIKETKDSSKVSRAITFEFNEEQAYALEFGEYYMRPYTDDGAILESTTTITGATQANPVVVSDTGHPYLDGEQIYIAGVVGMTELNGKYYTIANKTTNTYELSGVDGTSYTAYSSAGTSARVFTLTTPYAAADLALLKFRQSNDVMHLTHRSYAPQKLSRTGAAAWTIEEVAFEPEHPFPTGFTVTANTAGAVTVRYRVTAIDEETAEESLVGLNATSETITGATAANPVVLTITGHPYADGDEIHVDSVVGMVELNDRRFVVANQAANTIELKGEDGTGYTAYSSGGNSTRTFVEIANGAVTADNTIAISPEVAGTGTYKIYKEDNGLYGLIGSTETLEFTDDNIEADLTDGAPKWRQPFAVSGDYPGCTALHEQRSVWGNTTDDPLKTWLSQTSQFYNMNVSSPTRETDAVTLRLVTGQGNEIRHFRSFQERLFAFTSGVVWTIKPGGDLDAITQSSKKVGVEEYLACTDTPPLTVKSNILMVAGKQSRGFEVHSLGYRLETDLYAGSDLTILARHLFEDYTISEWAYAERPHRLVAAVRSDGKLLVMTYMQEHQVFAWTLWETDGEFESVINVSEGQVDAFYFIIKRTINGSTVRYVEKLHSRAFSDIEDAFFVDSGLTLDITNAVSITGATQADPVVISSTGHPYEDGDSVYITSVGGMTEINNRLFTVANKTANTYELLGVDGTAYTAYTSGGSSQKKVTALSNLDHLEGETLIALVDGNLETGLVVSSGATTLTNAGSVVHIGLPYEGLIDSIPLDLAPATVSRKKIVKQVTLRVQNTRGLFVGPDADNLEEYPSRSTELWGDPAATLTDLIKIPISDDWQREASVTIKSEPGLPMTILFMAAETDVGS